nr:diacylglycerol kinase family protein [Oceanobacter mangrovi]
MVYGRSLFDRVVQRQQSGIHQLTDNLWFASSLSPADLLLVQRKGISAVLDLSPELPVLQTSARLAGLHYQAAGIPPTGIAEPDQLIRLLDWLEQQRQQGAQVLIHVDRRNDSGCFLAAAHLLTLNPHLHGRELVAAVDAGPGCQLSAIQLRALERYRQRGVIKPLSQLWLIVDSRAGDGQWQAVADEATRLLQQDFVITLMNTGKDNARDLALLALARRADVVVACGGDDILLEVAGVVADSNAVMGMIPLDESASLCASLLGMDVVGMSVSQACQQILQGHIRRLDTADCNGDLLLQALALGAESQLQVSFDDGEFVPLRVCSFTVANRLANGDWLDGSEDGLAQDSGGRLMVRWQEAVEQSSVNVSRVLPRNVTELVARFQPHHQGPASPNPDSLSPDRPGHDRQTMDLQKPDSQNHIRQADRICIRANTPIEYLLDGSPGRATELDIRVHSASLELLSA